MLHKKLRLNLDDDLLQDLGISPNHAAPFVTCGKCGIDITDFTPVEIAAHARFHGYMADAPHSIPSQGPMRRLEDFPRHDVSGHLWI